MLREGKELLQVTLRTELRTWGLVCQARDLNLAGLGANEVGKPGRGSLELQSQVLQLCCRQQRCDSHIWDLTYPPLVPTLLFRGPPWTPLHLTDSEP